MHGRRRRRRSSGRLVDKVKTDRRDAERLARLLRLGELVAVRVPRAHEEAARDLGAHARMCAVKPMRARHRLSKLLLRHGLVYDAQRLDGRPRRPGCVGQRFDSRPLALAFDESYAAVLQAKATPVTCSTKAIAELAAEPPFAETVGRLCCLRGVSDADRACVDGRAW